MDEREGALAVQLRWRVVPLVVLSILLATPATAIGVTWGPIRPVTTSGQAAAWSGSTAVYNGGIAIVYREIVEGDYHVYIKRSGDGGTTWSSPRRLSSPNASLASRPSLTAGGWKLDAAFVEDRIDGSSKVVYRRSTDGGATWSTPLALSPSGVTAGFPSITRSGTKVVVAWTNELTGKIGVRISTDGGNTFGPRSDIATTTNQPWLDEGRFELDGFPTVAVTDGVVNVAFYTTQAALKLRRTSNQGVSWTTAATLTTSGNGYFPQLVSKNSTVLLGFAIYTGFDVYTAFRRSTDEGRTWSTVAALSGASAPPSYQPVLAFRLGKWLTAFERCLDEACARSDVYYRESFSGQSWGPASRVTNGPGDGQLPVGVTYDEGIIVTFQTGDADATSNILLRKGN